ncbi:hypothetical protein B0O80DRAFT_443786 [Mortierella sp. GBAus27b]|nr:hypothetical protein B0O80DRAFT_443786 [Mortierella sp. GBAus27b]
MKALSFFHFAWEPKGGACGLLSFPVQSSLLKSRLAGERAPLPPRAHWPDAGFGVLSAGPLFFFGCSTHILSHLSSLSLSLSLSILFCSHLFFFWALYTTHHSFPPFPLLTSFHPLDLALHHCTITHFATATRAFPPLLHSFLEPSRTLSLSLSLSLSHSLFLLTPRFASLLLPLIQSMSKVAPINTAPASSDIRTKRPDNCIINNNTNHHSNSNSSSPGGAIRSDSLPSPTSPVKVSSFSFPTRLRPRCNCRIPEDDAPLTDQDRKHFSQELVDLEEFRREAQEAYDMLQATVQRFQQAMLTTHAQVAAAKKELLETRQRIHSKQQQQQQQQHAHHYHHHHHHHVFSSPMGSVSTCSLTSSSVSSADHTHEFNTNSSSSQQSFKSTRACSSNASSRAPTPPLSPPLSPPHALRSHRRQSSVSLTDRLMAAAAAGRDADHNSWKDRDPSPPPPSPQRRDTDPPSTPTSMCSLDDDEDLLDELHNRHVELGAKLSQLLQEKAFTEDKKKQVSDELKRARIRTKEIEHRMKGLGVGVK